MKYIITESKMNSAIYNFIDEIFESKDGNNKIFKLNAFAEREPLTDAFDFVNSDYYSDDGSDYLFGKTDASTFLDVDIDEIRFYNSTINSTIATEVFNANR